MLESVASVQAETLCRLCQSVIASLPADSSTPDASHRQLAAAATTAATASAADRVHIDAAIQSLHDYWRRALYHAKKAPLVVQDFVESGVDDATAQRIAAIWIEEGAKVAPVARALSRSGVPTLRDVSWTLCLERATRHEGAKREPYVSVQLETSAGRRRVALNADELRALHVELRKAQVCVDSLYK